MTRHFVGREHGVFFDGLAASSSKLTTASACATLQVVDNVPVELLHDVRGLPESIFAAVGIACEKLRDEAEKVAALYRDAVFYSGAGAVLSL